MSYDVIVKFIDGREKIIKDANGYGYDGVNMFHVEKSGYNIFIPKEMVLYIGRRFDLKDEEQMEEN